MKRKKMTPEELRAYIAAREQDIQKLRDYVSRGRAELEAKRGEKPA